MLARLALGIAIAALHPLSLLAQRNYADSAIVATVAAPKSQAVDRVVQAFTSEGIAVNGSEGGVVTGAGREKSVDVKYVAAVISRDSANSLVTLSAFAKYTPYFANTVKPLKPV